MVTVYCGSQSFRGVDAIIFDKDGTLADSRAFLYDLAQRRSQAIQAAVGADATLLLKVFGASNADLDSEGLMAVGTLQENLLAAASVLAQQGYGWLKAKTLAEEAFDRVTVSPHQKAQLTPPYDGTRTMLSQLKAAGGVLGLVSADSPDNVWAFLQTYHLESLFNGWEGISDPHLAKPHPAPLQSLCDRLAVAPARVLIVGDTALDAGLARAVGACFISVSSAWGVLPVPGADATLEQWSDLVIAL